MKTLISIAIVALCLSGCDSETTVVSNGRMVNVRTDARLSYVAGENGRLIECVIFDGYEGDSISCNWEKYNAEGKVKP